MSNTLQDIVLTMFWDARTDARMNRTKKYAYGHTMLGGDITNIMRYTLTVTHDSILTACFK